MKRFNGDRFFVSGKALAAHKFHKLHRKIYRSLYDDKETLERLYQLRAGQLKSGVRQLSGVFLIYFAVTNNSASLTFDFEVPYFSFSISKYILVLAASVLWCFGLLSLNAMAICEAYINVVAKRIAANSGWPLVSRYYNADGNYGDPSISGGEFFRTTRIQSGLGSCLLWMLMLLVLGFCTTVLWEFFSILTQSIGEHGVLSREGLLGVVSISVFSLPIIHCMLTNLPFPVSYDRSFVRWNFLYSIARRSGIQHPQAFDWLDRD